MDILEDANIEVMNLSVQLSRISILGEAEGISDIEKRLNDAQRRISQWMQNTSIIWLQPDEKVADFFSVVNEICLLSQVLNNLPLGEGGKYSMLAERAHTIFQTAMALLQNEFRQVLTFSRQSFGPVCRMSFCSSEDGIVHYRENENVSGFSSFSSNQLTSAVTIWGDSISMSSEHNIDLVDLDVIPHLKNIAKLMFILNCKNELSQAYISVRKDALDDCLHILGMEKLTTDDMSKMEWTALNSKIRKHIRAVKLFVRGYLASEKSLCEKIFNEFGSIKSECFVEASRISVLQLLNFPDSVAKVATIGPHSPEKLFRLLDMYGVLNDLLPDIHVLFSESAICSVPREFIGVLIRLGDCIREVFLDLVKTIASQTARKPFAGGGVNPFTRYVVNQVKLLSDYGEILNLILSDNNGGDSCFFPSDDGPAIEKESEKESSFIPSPMTLPFRLVLSTLKSNLEDQSELYKDSSLKHFYLMNNINYIFHNINNSEVGLVLGEEWVKSNLRLNRQHHAFMYVRTAWSPIYSLFKVEFDFPRSKRVSKEWFHAFNATFEKIYESQTALFIHDPQLRGDLQIVISVEVVMLEYGTFLRRYDGIINSKYIKYTYNDVEDYILDLFEGNPRKQRRSSKGW